MRSVIICFLSLLFVSALGAPVENQGQPSSSDAPSTRLPSVNQLATHEPRIHLAPINPPSTRPSSAPLPSIHQLLNQPLTHQPPTNQPPQVARPHPVPPSVHPPPPHGQLVAFQGNNAPHAGVILGSQPDQHNRYKIAPVRYVGQDHARQPLLAASIHQVVKVHQDNILATRLSSPISASHLMDFHAQHTPAEAHVTEPVYGSRNYVAIHGRPGSRRQR